MVVIPKGPNRIDRDRQKRRIQHRRSLSWIVATFATVSSLSSQKSVVEGIKLSADAWKSLRTDPTPLPSIEELQSQDGVEERIDFVLDRIQGVGESGDKGQIIQGYRPEANWLRRQWYGTVLVNAAPKAAWNMAVAVAFCVCFQYWVHDGEITMARLFESPTSSLSDRPIVLERLQIVDKIWKTLMSLTTFLLTFFVGQAYTFWRNVHDLGRSVQGRFNDINMLLATHAARENDGGGGRKRTSNGDAAFRPPPPYTPEALVFLRDVQQKLRTFHLLFWAAKANRYRVLLTPKGLRRMVDRGLMTESELKLFDCLVDLPPTQLSVASLESVVTACEIALINPRKIDAFGAGTLRQHLFGQFCRLRGTSGSVGDAVAARMPLAYAHFVQILVDSFLLLAPVAQYAELGIFSVIAVGILTMFYHGMLDLAKVFLDPLDNEDYAEGCVYLDLIVLIRESNSSSARWMNGVVPSSNPSSLVPC